MARLIIPRSAWDARPPAGTNLPKLDWPVEAAVGHHTASSMPKEFHDGDGGDTKHDIRLEQDLMRSIQAYHMDVRKWTDIGYNQVIFPSGRIYQGRGRRIGAHVDSFNSRSIGVALFGNFEVVRPTPEAIEAFTDLVVFHRRRGHLALIQVFGHRDKDPQGTACPGDKFYRQLDDIQRLARRRFRD